MTAEITCQPISPKLGAVISGVVTKSPLSPEQVSQLKTYLLKYKVLFFREQYLSYEEQETFASFFGELRFDPLENCIDAHPGLALVDNVPFFHADWMHQENPPLFSMLQMNTVPEVGGDTMFADLVTSYQDLSGTLQQFLQTLTVTQCHPKYEGDGSALARSYLNERNVDFDFLFDYIQPRSQPLVRYISETGESNYWLSRAYSRRINELTSDESEMLLHFLFRHQIEPQYVIRWRWHEGDIAFWDHRTTIHSGVKDYGEFPRQGCRASISGGRLVPTI
ncbi:MAG TPA: TauD/TfdA family dioxygenase [Acidimicrobiales bacterium]|nr:TauD/TfdA family dioxygenase [Acidimicrobiales bacterium]